MWVAWFIRYSKSVVFKAVLLTASIQLLAFQYKFQGIPSKISKSPGNEEKLWVFGDELGLSR